MRGLTRIPPLHVNAVEISLPDSDTLASLHTMLIDTRSGYEEAAKDAKASDMAEFFRDMAALRSEDHDEIHRCLVAHGAHPDENGSFMASIHQTVIGLRAALTGLDRNALGSFASGEEHVLKAYDEALNHNRDRPELAAILARQRQRVAGMVEQMKALEGV